MNLIGDSRIQYHYILYVKRAECIHQNLPPLINYILCVCALNFFNLLKQSKFSRIIYP